MELLLSLAHKYVWNAIIRRVCTWWWHLVQLKNGYVILTPQGMQLVDTKQKNLKCDYLSGIT